YNEVKYIRKKTGKEPAIKGFDFILERENKGIVKEAIIWWKNGGIPTIMWHWGGPGLGEGYETSKGNINIDKCFVPGTEEYKEFWLELKAKADLLEQIKNANVPVIWRPYHEF